jgi:hypothetical protein
MQFRACSLMTFLLVSALTIHGCRDGPRVAAPGRTPAISMRLTADAARALNADGTFVEDAPESPDGTSMISSAQAVRQAMAFVRSSGQTLYPTWQRQHGGGFDLATIAPDSRVYFGHTPYEGTPRDLLPAMRRAYGPYFLVTLKAGAVPVVIVAVSAYNTDVSILGDGRIRLSTYHGADIIANGIPMDTTQYSFVSPEEAVARVTQATGAKAVEAPRLVLPGIRQMPVLPVWEVRLDREVVVREKGAGVARKSRTLMVSVRGKDRFLLSAPQAPSHVETRGHRMTANGQRGAVTPVTIRVRQGFTTVPVAVDVDRVM